MSGNNTVLQLSYYRSLKKLRDSTDKLEALLLELRRMTDASKFSDRITKWRRDTGRTDELPDDRGFHS